MRRVLCLLSCAIALIGAASDELSGRLLHSDGTPAAQATLILCRNGAEFLTDPGGSLATTTTAADGRFQVQVPSGEKHLALTATLDQRLCFCWGQAKIKAGVDLGDIRIAKPCRLEGTVRRDQQTLGGVQVRLFRGYDNSPNIWREALTLTTAADGTFVADGIASGTWAAEINDEAWTPARQTLTLSGEFAYVELVPETAAVVTGLVRDAGGKPVRGAFIDAGSRRTAITAADGRFRLGGLDGDRSSIQVKAAGLALVNNQRMAITTTVGTTTTHDITLQATGGIDASLNWENPGKTLPTSVMVALDAGREAGYPTRPITCVNGVVPLRDVAPGQYRLSISGADIAYNWTPVSVTSGQITALAITLPVEISLPVTVKAPAGTKLDGIQVRSLIQDHWELKGRKAFAKSSLDAVGNTTLTLLNNKRHKVWVGLEEGDLMNASCIVDLSAAEGQRPTRIDLELKLGRTLIGTVLDVDGKPVTAMQIGVHHDDLGFSAELYRKAEIGPDGSFRLVGLLPGRQWLRIHRPDTSRFTALHQQVLRIPAKGTMAPLTVRLPALGAVQGHVQNAKGKAGVFIMDPMKYLSFSFNTDDTGAFTVANLPVGRYLVGSSLGEQTSPFSGELSIEAGRTTTFNIATPTTTTLAAKCTLATIEGLPTANEVIALPQVGRPLAHSALIRQLSSMHQGTPDPQGGFTIQNLTPGPWILVWFSAQNVIWNESCHITDAAVPILAGAGGFMQTVQVTGPDGQALADVSLEAHPHLGSDLAIEKFVRRRACTDPTGKATIGALSEGLWDVTAFHEDFGWLHSPTSTFTKGGAPLSLRFARGATLSATITPAQSGTKLLIANALGRGPLSGLTDATGKVFLWSRLQPGEYEVFANDDEHAIAHRHLTVGTDPVALSLELVPGGSLHITLKGKPADIAGRLVILRDSTGASVGRFNLLRWIEQEEMKPFCIPPTETDGTVTIPNLPPGLYTVGLEGDTATTSVTVSAGTTAEAVINLATP